MAAVSQVGGKTAAASCVGYGMDATAWVFARNPSSHKIRLDVIK
jgi:hypothetical protein